jgi:dTDP-4-amino-4,6-dideoxygalactose transaminase
VADERPTFAGSAPETWPHYAEDEVAAVAAVLRSGKVNQWTGDKVRAFETALAAYHGVPHAIALANGSVAIELALISLGIGPGDEVIVTPRSFIASASSVDLVGATPVFADVDARSQNITPATIAPLVGPRTKAIIPVHLAGWPCDMPAIMDLARRHGLLVIEDCAQAIGARIGGRLAGTFGHAATFSFCQDKIVTTGGEGGALLTFDEALWRKAWSRKDHGKSHALTASAAPGPGFRWVHESLGSNWRMTEMQAAIGLAQMTKLDTWLGSRRRNAAIWREELRSLHCLSIPEPGADIEHANYKLCAFVEPRQLRPGFDRDAILAKLAQAGVRIFYGSCPEIYREKAYAHRSIERLPVAARLGETSLMLEVHPTLKPDTIRATARRIVELVAPMQRA